jgi:hypothetical protein
MAVQAANVKEVFLLEKTTQEQGPQVIRKMVNEHGLEGEPVQLPSLKMTSKVLLSAGEIISVGNSFESVFFFFEETAFDRALIVPNDKELASFNSAVQASVSKIKNAFNEKFPEAVIILGRTIPDV